MKWFTNAGARIETEPWMEPLNYWWPLVLYRHIMYTYSRKPAHLCVACARVYMRFCSIRTCAASRQVIYKYGAASSLARTYTHGCAKRRYERLAILPPAPSTVAVLPPPFSTPHPQSLAIFWKVLRRVVRSVIFRKNFIYIYIFLWNISNSMIATFIYTRRSCHQLSYLLFASYVTHTYIHDI